MQTDRWDVQFFGFNESNSAMDSLARHSMDLIVVDYSLGCETGIDVLNRIRTAGVECPVIMVSGHDRKEIREECMQHGAVGYFVKGALDVPAMIDCVDDAISKYSQLQSQ